MSTTTTHFDPDANYPRQTEAALAVSNGDGCHVKRDGTVTSVRTGARLGRVWKEGRSWRGARNEEVVPFVS